MIYAGIGSRKLPAEISEVFTNIGKYLGSCGWTLRSGGAEGSDLAFERGCDLVGGAKEIYIPWKNFNNSTSNLYHISDKARKVASLYHPRWDKLSEGGKKLHSRNCYQVLGENLNTPVDLIICYTENGDLSGGTAQALRIAQTYNIPVFNAGAYSTVLEFRRALRKYLAQLGY